MSDLLLRLLADSPPVRVNEIGTATIGGNFWQQTRFFITNDAVLVFVEEGGQPKLVGEAEILGFEPLVPARGAAITVRTAQGETWLLTPTGNCGCGSSLQYFNPFAISRKGE